MISPADDDTPLPGLRGPGRPGGARCRTTARWPGWRSASCPRAGCAAGSGRAASTCCTCTSPPRPACPCWPAGWRTGRSWPPCTPRSRARGSMHAAEPILQSALEKISGRIAVSEAARTTLVEHFGGDAVLIPNGVTVQPVREGRPAARLAGRRRRARLPGPDGRAAQGLGRAAARVRRCWPRSGPGCGCWSPGPATLTRCWPRCRRALRDRIVLLGQVSDEDKVRVYHSVDVFCAPNTGGESFGIVLAEAMAAGAPDRRQRPGRVPPGAARRPGGRAVPRPATAAALAAAAGRLLDRARAPGRACRPRRPRGACLRLAGGGPRRGQGLRGGGARGGRATRRGGPSAGVTPRGSEPRC